MSAPVSHDPLVVNTKDGSCWRRCAVTQSGHGLYALAAVQGDVPELVLSTLPELAEHGIAGTAFALPVPTQVDPGPVIRPLALHEAQIDALAASGNRAVNDAVHDDLCACDAWPEKCLSSGGFFQGYWDWGYLEVAIPAVLGLWESMRGGELERLRACVVELETDLAAKGQDAEAAVAGWGRARNRIAELEALTPARHQTCQVCGAGYVYGEPCAQCEFRARMAAESQARVRQPYRVGHDLPGLGGVE